MTGRFRKLNDSGLSEFSQYIRQGATESPPVRLLDEPTTSEPLKYSIEPGSAIFPDRYMFGIYLKTLLSEFDPAAISGERGLWSGLALLWFDRLCPKKADGTRTVGREYRYILSADYRHYYRHLVRSPWQLVRDHGEASRFLLTSPRQEAHPLSVHGDILEQLAGRQQVLRSRPIIKAASKLYFDNETKRPRTGVAARRGGTANRFGLVLRQFALTYDAESMTEDAFIELLPSEFERWK